MLNKLFYNIFKIVESYLLTLCIANADIKKYIYYEIE